MKNVTTDVEPCYRPHIHFQVTNTCFAKSLMAAWHQREARFVLRYQTHLTVVRLIIISHVDGGE